MLSVFQFSNKSYISLRIKIYPNIRYYWMNLQAVIYLIGLNNGAEKMSVRVIVTRNIRHSCKYTRYDFYLRFVTSAARSFVA